MQFSILQQDLYPVLATVSRAVGIRTTLPILANILIEASNDTLRLSATNLEIGLVKKIKADITEGGSVSVPAKTFLDMISSLSGTKLEITASQTEVSIRTDNFSATLNTIPANEFPAIPLDGEDSIIINSDYLRKSLPEISFAAAVDEGRPVLTGILTELKKDGLELVATDGFRLAHKSISVDTNSSLKVLIPKKTFEEVLKIIAEEKDSDTMQISTTDNKNQIIFSIGNTQVSSRLIEGKYPSWEPIIPTEFISTIELDRAKFLKSVKLASVFARDGAGVVKVSVKSNSLILNSETKEVGSQQTELEAKIQTKEDLVVAFNSRFLIDTLNACPGEEIVMKFSGPLSAAYFAPNHETGLEYIVMPVRVN